MIQELKPKFATRQEYYQAIYKAIDEGVMPSYSPALYQCLYEYTDSYGKARHCIAGLLCPEGSLPPERLGGVAVREDNKEYFLHLLPPDMNFSELCFLQDTHDQYAGYYIREPEFSWQGHEEEIKEVFRRIENDPKWSNEQEENSRDN